MAFEDWEKRPDGNVAVYPVAGWDTFIPFGMMCGVRFHYAETPGHLAAEKFEYLPLILTPAQARELAQALLRNADKAEKAPGAPGS